MNNRNQESINRLQLQSIQKGGLPKRKNIKV